MRKAADQWSAPTGERGFRVRIPQSPSQAPVPAPFRQGGLWRAPGARSFDSLCSLRMTARDRRRDQGIAPYAAHIGLPLHRGSRRAADSRPYGGVTRHGLP